MTDTRARVALTKNVDLDLLTAEVGAALCASETEVVVADADSPVTVEQLQTALDAHAAPAAVDHDAEFRKAVEGATDLAGLKAALLGTKGPGAEPRRPDSI